MKRILFLAAVVLISGCSHSIEVNNQKYYLFSPGETNGVIGKVPLYTKKSVNDAYFTPSLDGKGMIRLPK